jgi:hypothetical protein
MEDLIDVFAAYSPLAKEQGDLLREAGHDGDAVGGRDTVAGLRADPGVGNASGGVGGGQEAQEIEATVRDVFDAYSGSSGYLARENVGVPKNWIFLSSVPWPFNSIPLLYLEHHVCEPHSFPRICHSPLPSVSPLLTPCSVLYPRSGIGSETSAVYATQTYLPIGCRPFSICTWIPHSKCQLLAP